MQFVQNAGPFTQADLGLRCPFTDSIDTVVYVYDQRMSRSARTEVQADLGLHCSHMA